MHRTTPAEQRTKPRELTSFSIRLRVKGEKITNCKALNLSIAGMLLDYNGAYLDIGASIDICARFKGWEAEISAVVIHCNSNCIGIMFCKPQPDLYRMVTQSMRSSHLSINSRTPVSFVA